MTVPQVALTLAVEALEKIYTDRGWNPPHPQAVREYASAALKAAAPHIAAAERDRIRHLAIQHEAWGKPYTGTGGTPFADLIGESS